MEIQAAWDAGDRTAAARSLSRPICSIEWERRLDDFAAQRLAQPRPAARRRRTSSTSASPTAAATTPTASSCGSRPSCATTSSTATGRHIKSEGQLGETRPPARVLDAAPARRPLDPRVDRAGRRGLARARTRRSSPRHGPTSRRCATRRWSRAPSPTPSPRERASPRSRTSSSKATRAPRRSTSASPTAASLPTCSRSRRGARSPRGPRPSTATTQGCNAIAHPEAARELLHPGDPSGATRLVVRGPRVKQIRIVALDAAATPPTMTIEVDLDRPALHRGSRHGRGAGGQPVARDELHRALDVRARRRRRSSRGGSPPPARRSPGPSAAD